MKTFNFTSQFADALRYARSESERLGSERVCANHILLGILRIDDCMAVHILLRHGVEVRELKKRLDEIACTKGACTMQYDDFVERVLALSNMVSIRMGDLKIDTHHFLVAVATLESDTRQVLESFNVTSASIKQTIAQYKSEQSTDDAETIEQPIVFKTQLPNFTDQLGNFYKEFADDQPHRESKKQATKEKHGTPALDNFAKDLTQLAADGKLDPCVGREREIARVMQILNRRKKNNPVLIGEAGVGKTAIIEGLAQKVITGAVPSKLFNKKILSLNVGSLVAGTKYRGQFEERMQTIIGELEENPDIILFIDEIHTIMGAGSTQGSLDAANMLKPALSRGTIQCIGSTTLNEYRKSIESDGAMERRFQKIIVDEPTPEATLTILQNVKDYYEKYHNVVYSDAALTASVRLAARYISDRAFPDKALDLIDEAGAKLSLVDAPLPKEIVELDSLILDVINAKKEAVAGQNYELAALKRSEELELKAKREKALDNFRNNGTNKPVVTEDMIMSVVSGITGVPVHKMAQAENARLLNMADELKKVVIGQSDAIERISKSIRRSRVGLKNPARPIGSFIFLGPTGVGKTLLAKQLAKYMFGSEDDIIRVDMSEYMEQFNVSRLVGAPPGYVGYEEGGQLTERVRRRPYSIVLFDEIEKAHHDVFNILLQVLDEGMLTDGLGRKVDFKNTIIIMTSNVGSRQIKEFGRGIGFNEEIDFEGNAKDITRKALERTFSPEFLNRVDDIIQFNSLTRSDIDRIIQIEIDKINRRCAEQGISISLTPEAIDFLAQKGYNPQYGARPLQRAIETHLQDLVVDKILASFEPLGNLKIAFNDTSHDLEIVDSANVLP